MLLPVYLDEPGALVYACYNARCTLHMTQNDLSDRYVIGGKPPELGGKFHAEVSVEFEDIYPLVQKVELNMPLDCAADAL